MFEAVGDVLNKANDLLGGGAGGGGTTGKPEFKRVGPLSTTDSTQQGSVGSNAGGTTANALNLKPPIEFIHFGRIHSDNSKFYEHDELKDEPGEEKKLGRAIMFRNALEREALLLDGFISATKEVLQEYQDNKGLLGDVGAAAEKLFGSGSSEPKPEELDAFKQKVSAAGGKINASEIAYEKIHQAGIDLNQTRADFQAFTKKLEEYYIKGAGGADAALTSLPAVAKNAAMVRKIIFKMYDIYVGIFLSLRREYEKPIEEQCYQITLKAITEIQCPTFAVWFAKQENKAAAPAAPKKSGGLLSPLTDAIDDAKQKVDDVKKDVNEFIGAEDDDSDPAPGDSFLSSVFSTLASSGGNDDQKKTGKQAADLVVQAFTDVLGLGQLPPFVGKILTEVSGANVEFLQAVYQKVLSQSAGQAISEDLLMAVGRQYLLHKIVNLIVSMTSLDFLNSSNKLVDVQGMGVSGQDLTNKAINMLDNEAGQHAEHILKIAVGELAPKLNAVRDEAAKNKALTMEILLGHLPHYLALMVRNTFFPIWDIIVDKVFGSIAGPLAGAASPIKQALGTGKDIAKQGQDIYNRVNNAQQQLASGINVLNPDELKKFGDNIMGNDAGAGDTAGGGSFPGGARVVPGKSKKIEKSEIDAAEAATQKIEAFITAE
ncbi:MAG: hypothetical protein U0Y68_17770 [Blastocatellia bacterium]